MLDKKNLRKFTGAWNHIGTFTELLSSLRCIAEYVLRSESCVQLYETWTLF